MRWIIKNRIISELEIGGRNIIRPWGIETADSSTFFSSDASVGYRYTIEHADFKSSDRSNTSKIIAKMHDGRVEISTNDQLMDDDSIARSAGLTARSEAWLMDFVVRYRFKKEFIQYAEINGQRYEHRGSNIYHQFPVDRVLLKGTNFNAVIRVTETRMPESFAQYMYVRDAKDEWVVHARLLPRTWDREVIKLCNFWYQTRPLPKMISQPLLRWPAVRKALWYRGERAPYRNKVAKLINPIAYPLVQLSNGQQVSLTTECRLHLSKSLSM